MGDFGRGLYRLSLQRGTGVCEEEGGKKKKRTISAKSPVTAGICKLSHTGKIFLLKLDKEYE